MRAKLISRTIQSLNAGTRPYDVRDTELSGFLLRVNPSGAMVYFCDYRRPDNRRTRVKIGDAKVLTPAQARDEALKVLGDVARNQDPGAVRRATRRETLGTFIEKLYKPWAQAHRRTGSEIVRCTYARFPEFKNQVLAEISPWKVEKWRSRRIKEGITAATVNRNITMLKSILSKAVEWDVIEAHPLAKVKPLKTDQCAKIRYLDADEEAALRAALDAREVRICQERRSHNDWCRQRGYEPWRDLDCAPFADYLKPMVLISINTGLRRGEVFNLKWDDIDLRRRNLTVVGATAKSGKTRHIPLNREALETFSNWKSQADPSNKLVFPNREGARFDNIDTSWRALFKAAGLIGFRWHDLRHHFASKLVMVGVDLNTVRELLGHGDLTMTLRYVHLAPEVKADAVAQLDSPTTGKQKVNDKNGDLIGPSSSSPDEGASITIEPLGSPLRRELLLGA